MLTLLLALACVQSDAEIRRHLSERAAALERDFFPGVKSASDFEAQRPRLRDEYLYMLGLSPLPEKTPLKPVITGRLEFDAVTVEKLHFQSRPGLYVTANLYLPRPARGKYPAILYACGHSNQKRDGNKTAYQDHGLWFASHGYVCLVFDTLQLGEIAAIHHGTYREQRWGWHDRGYTSAGVECWNSIRAIDYLETRPEVDASRIGATGISGGGASTFWISAADERVKAAAPVSGMADLGYYVGKDGVNGHCDCMFLHNTHRWNWTGIAALVAPRPLLFVNSDADPIFPMDANERVINRLEALYSKFGAGDRVDAVVSVGGHAYRTDLRRAVFEFFNRAFKGDARPVTDPDAGLLPDGKRRIPARDLRVFPEDSDLPADQINTKIDESFVPARRPELPSAEGFESWRKGLLAELRRVSFGAWPNSPLPPAEGVTDGALSTEDGVEVRVRSRIGSGNGTRWLLVLDPGEKPEETPEWAKDLVGPDPVLLLAPRGGWTRKNPPNTVERSMALLGMTADSGRVWDVLSVARRAGPVRVAGRGASGVIGAYAALYEPSVVEVVAVDPPASHGDGPHFLNVLRVLDVPDALGMLAPRPLRLVGAKNPAFDRTAELYRIAGAADALRLVTK
jgi:dienelactone hydrolase